MMDAPAAETHSNNAEAFEGASYAAPVTRAETPAWAIQPTVTPTERTMLANAVRSAPCNVAPPATGTLNGFPSAPPDAARDNDPLSKKAGCGGKPPPKVVSYKPLAMDGSG